MVPVDKQPWPSLGGQVCDWIESNLCFGPGDLRGNPAVLDDEKRALIWRIYEVYPQGHALAGRRRFRRVGISLRKGVAKTELAAWIAAAELHHQAPVRCIGWTKKKTPIGGPVTDPYIPMVATTEDQSDELAYGALKAILEESVIAKDFDIGLERIMRRDGKGKATSLANSPNAADGARTTFQVFDETHRHTSQRLRNAHQTMMANLPKRKVADAWSLEITTAPEPGAGSIAEATMQYAQQIADGKIKDASLFFFHRQASDEHDLTTRAGAKAAIIEASGPSAGWSNIEAIVDMWSDPTTDRIYWERVYCNRLVKGASQAFDVLQWRTLRRTDAPVTPGDLITIGFDGAMFHDATAIVCTHVSTGHQWVAGVWECPPGMGTKDRPWQVPVADVDAVMRSLFETYHVWRLYADPPYWQSQIAAWRGVYGEERVIEWWTTRTKQMAVALEGFDTSIKNGALSHDGSADLERHVANARRNDLPQRDEQGRPLWVIRKERPDSPHKIDAAMAAVLSWEARTDAVASGALSVVTSVYLTRGVRTLGE
jgi:hypothetical protein